jgi:protein-tyrosine-phosphatase
MCEAMQWTGPAMFEFKADPATGRMALMEINGRLWGSLALSVAAGVDFPKLIYDMLVKQERINVFSYRTPCFARNTRRDFFWFFDNLKTPTDHPQLLKVTWPALTRELGNVLLGREHLDAEQLSDPLPALLSWVEVGRELTARLGSKLDRARGNSIARRMTTQVQSQDPYLLRLLREVRSVLFLCQGNIHRSAFAEQKTQNSRHWEDDLRVTSAGFIPEEGRPTTQYSLKVAKAFGVDLSQHRSKAISENLLAHADLIFVMDREQLLQLRAMDAAAVKRTVLLGALDPQTSDWEIADPDGKSQEVYHHTYAKIGRCIEAWLQIRYEGAYHNSPTGSYGSTRLLSTAK